MSTAAQWFWGITTLACLVWYSTMTFLVAYRGVIDIRGMLGRLRQGQLDDEAELANRTKPDA
jgi:hypothetical protein